MLTNESRSEILECVCLNIGDRHDVQQTSKIREDITMTHSRGRHQGNQDLDASLRPLVEKWLRRCKTFDLADQRESDPAGKVFYNAKFFAYFNCATELSEAIGIPLTCWQDNPHPEQPGLCRPDEGEIQECQTLPTRPCP